MATLSVYYNPVSVCLLIHRFGHPEMYSTYHRVLTESQHLENWFSSFWKQNHWCQALVLTLILIVQDRVLVVFDILASACMSCASMVNAAYSEDFFQNQIIPFWILGSYK